MEKKNEKGFFLSETILVITVVAVVLLGVFKLFSSVYYGFKESENYNTINAINALSNVQKYYESIDYIDVSSLTETNTYIDLNIEEKYASDYYERIKEEFNVTNVYLIDLNYFFNSNDINNFPALLRRYMKTLKKIEGIIMIAVVNGNEFSYVKIGDTTNIELIGEEDDEYGVYVNVGDTFVDPGYTGWNGDVPQTSWENDKTLDTNIPGTYYLHYNFEGYVFRRKVVVGNYNEFFSYTENEQEYIVNAPGYYLIELWGAQGGGTNGGKGGYSSGIIELDKGDILKIYVGGAGNSLGYGGYNGGGNAGTLAENNDGGGGSTDVRYAQFTINDRIMVASGGGGANADGSNIVGIGINGGVGGGLIGYSGTSVIENMYGKGATQVSGGTRGYTTMNPGTNGSFYSGGMGGTSNETPMASGGAGGGGGYYGGGSGEGCKNNCGASGGGGSSFISGYAGVNAITSSTNIMHTNNTLHYSNKYFINGKMESGVREGNGKAQITYMSQNYPKTNTRIDNVRYIKDCINGSTASTDNRWTELQAIYKGVNIAKSKNVTGTSSQNSSFPYSRITDGDITSSKYAQAGTSGSLQCVTVDLTEIYDLDEIAVWHYYEDTRSYNNHSLYVSSDNTNWTALINNVSGVIETSNGIRVSAYD